MVENILEEIKEKYADSCISDEQVEKDIIADYEDLIDLRNRIADGTDDDTTLYEEDHIVLDHILDYMEVFMKYIKGKEKDVKN